MENENNISTCPHCGDETPPKSVVISIQSQKDPVFLPQQRPPRTVYVFITSIASLRGMLVHF